jgi:ketosteroid isomerase-like protein
MSRGTLGFLCAALLTGATLYANDAESLKATHEARLKAIETGDAHVLVSAQHPEGVNFEGHSPFPSDESERSDDERRRGWEAGFDRAERRSFHQINPGYRVIGNTGIVWGHVRITVDPKDGPRATEYRRFTHVYVREGGEWKLVLYHSSAIPTEDRF